MGARARGCRFASDSAHWEQVGGCEITLVAELMSNESCDPIKEFSKIRVINRILVYGKTLPGVSEKVKTLRLV